MVNHVIPYRLARALALLTFALVYLHCGASLWRALLAAYAPIFFDDAPLHGKRAWPAFARLRLWRFVVSRVLDVHLRVPACTAATAAMTSSSPSAAAAPYSLDPTQQYLFAAHPHGVMCWAHYALFTDGRGFLSAVTPGIERRDLGATVLFWCPLLRDMCLWLGCVSAHRRVAERLLREGKSLLVYAGGEAEQLLTEPGRHAIVLRRRKGFLRLALRHGAHIVPTYAFGENELYRTFPRVARAALRRRCHAVPRPIRLHHGAVS